MANPFTFEKDLNPFDILGMEPAFDIDTAALDEAYFARQTLVHPDRFVYHTEPDRQAAAVQAASLNRAYEILKKPLLRARALLNLRNIDVGGEEGKTVQDACVLEEMMSLQEAVMEAMSPRELTDVESQVQDQWQQVTASFREAIRQEGNSELPKLFLRLTYLSKLREDIKARQRQSSIKVL